MCVGRNGRARRVIILHSLKSLLGLRAVLVTGKGGVGKTTVSAALARAAAATGKRVLCTEMYSDAEQGSPLAAALGVPELGDQPVEIAPGIRAAVLSPSLGHHKFLRDVLPMKLLGDAAMRSAAIRRFFSAAPTFPEMGVLYRLLDLVRDKRRDGTFEHELIIVDLPATGHALALAQIPESLLKVIPTGAVADAVREGLAFLRDPEQTGAVVVTLPENLPVSEAIELTHAIHTHQIPLAHVFVNRVPYDPFGPGERELLARVLDGKPPVLGARSLDRIDRARDALARLTGEVRAPLSVVQDVWLEGPRLAEEVASLFSMERFA